MVRASLVNFAQWLLAFLGLPIVRVLARIPVALLAPGQRQ
jgi:hypothetical protein